MDMAASVSPKLGPFSFERGEAALRCRRTGIEKLGNGCDKLGRRERLGQKEAVRDAMRGPLVGTGTGHVFTVRSNRLI